MKRSIRVFAIILALGAPFASLPTRAADPSVSCSRVTQINTNDPSRFIELVKDIGIAPLSPKDPGDRITGGGDLLRKACFEGLDAKQSAREAQRLEEMLSGARQQLAQCGQYYGFKDMEGLAQLNRSIILSCEHLAKTTGASATNSPFDLSVDPGLRIFLGEKKRRYAVPAATIADIPYFNGDRTVILLPAFMRLNIDSMIDGKEGQFRFRESDYQQYFTSVLAHELMHFLSNNSRNEVHNDPEIKKECGPKSLFRDRVYLIQLSCFPFNAFFSDNEYCEKDCMDNLTQPSAWDGYEDRPGKRIGGGPFSKVYTEKEALPICQKIGRAHKLLRARVTWAKGLRKIFSDENVLVASKLASLINDRPESHGLGTPEQRKEWETQVTLESEKVFKKRKNQVFFADYAISLPEGWKEADPLELKALYEEKKRTYPNDFMKSLKK